MERPNVDLPDPDRASFSIAVEPIYRLMRIDVRGFWDAEIMRTYVTDLGRRADSLRTVGGCRRILVDMSRFPVQSRSIAEAHGRIIEHGKSEMRALTAVVMQSALAKLQAKRIAGLFDHEIFGDAVAARDWLISQPIEN